MKILDKKLFSSGSIYANPGDTLIVTWSNGKRMRTLIKEKQVLDTAILIEYSEKEAKELDFKKALGCFVGKSL